FHPQVQAPPPVAVQRMGEVGADEAIEEGGAEADGAERAIGGEGGSVARPAQITEERDARGRNAARDFAAGAPEGVAAGGVAGVAAQRRGAAEVVKALRWHVTGARTGGTFERAAQLCEQGEGYARRQRRTAEGEVAAGAVERERRRRTQPGRVLAEAAAQHQLTAVQGRLVGDDVWPEHAVAIEQAGHTEVRRRRDVVVPFREQPQRIPLLA